MDISGTENREWNIKISFLVDNLNSFNAKDSSKDLCYTFIVEGNLIGFIRPDILVAIKTYDAKKFLIIDDEKKCVFFDSKYQTYEERTAILNEFLFFMKDKNIFKSLNGWRNENYIVKSQFYSKGLFEIERSAVCIFGVMSYGCHINGYVKEDNKYKMWLARRSPTKQTFPNLLDNLTAGGLTAGLKLGECVVKELQEECGLDDGTVLNKLKPVDAITYAYECDEGIYRECEFIFDIKLPCDFKPCNKDGEVQDFYLMTIEQVMKAIGTPDFKPNSGLVALNFLMRKGLIDPDTNSEYLNILAKTHNPGF